MSERRTFQFLNVMRLISAVWVVLSHIASSPLNKEAFDPQAAWVLKVLLLPFSGVAAVMVFFVISGFCIHCPYAAGKTLKLTPFYLQRLARIGLPLLAAIIIHYGCGTVPAFKNVLWSIYCEIIYYVIYPLLQLLMKRLGMYRVLLGSCVVSWLFCLLPEEGYGHIMAYGNAWTWLVCLPVWLGGCVLANWLAGVDSAPSIIENIGARLGRHLVITRWLIWGLSSLLLALGMKQIFPFKYSLPLFGLVVIPWLLAEMRRPDRATWMARWGVAGYSIYLIHPLAEMPAVLQLSGHQPLLLWLVKIFISACAAALFYFVVEKPSHQLARMLGSARRTLVQ